MSERQVLERARDRIGPPSLDLDSIYRRRARRQTRRRLSAGLTVLLVLAVSGGLLARSLGTAAPVVPRTSDGSGGQPVVITDLPSFLDLRAVAANATGFVAVGDTSVGDSTDPVWFSADGESWSRAPAADAPDSPNLWSVTANGTGFIAVGLDNTGKPAAWYSTDGLIWDRATVDLPIDIGDVDAIFGVTPVPDGYLAWGRLHDGDAYVWHSSDGRSWASLPGESVFGGPGEQFIMWAGPTSDGFAAGGYERPDGSTGTGHDAAWTSPDGITWQRVQSLTTTEFESLRSSIPVDNMMKATNDSGTIVVEGGASKFAGSTITFTPVGT